jgi:hypothetical protein
MIDKELLELAAKAAGYKHEVTPLDPEPYRPAYWSGWNPLTDDGDALRLAVKLGMNIYSGYSKMIAELTPDGDCRAIHESVERGIDSYAATRRAIVRAAAEIGKEMQ